MTTNLHARAEGTTLPTNDDGPTVAAVAHQVSKQDKSANSDGAHRAGQAPCVDDGKAFATLRACLALAGFALHRVHLQPGAASALMVARGALSRTLPDLAAVAAFLDQAGVRHG